ncbi:CDP-glucose 4,6-dehydratase [Methylomonas sp. LL1]|uniref:CDP-glucose 4,6-dehydratase n=1 Tax=Methylomonas sp. LL1 TaxID=2785785 RepID=UPI0018C3CE0C|nr:CDP-glucose 4,6-dehydratase [Methylomonas sp. LL1]
MEYQSTLESLVVEACFGGIYSGRRVLVTGHTGFKGSWLSLWLQAMGAQTSGLALAPNTEPNHWGLLNLDMPDHRYDIRDAAAIAQQLTSFKPEIIFHLAAQPLVRRSYLEPLETWSTNVMGTLNLLEAARQVEGVLAIVIVTTDKCYENREWPWGYREDDALGGHDPYSASKAAAEIAVASYRRAFFHGESLPLLATARAGNVIGGGDWSEDRLIPDLMRAVSAGRSLEIRSPNATRPWQHVLESLSGYLLLGQQLLEGKQEFASSWNFGPEPDGNRSVVEVLARMQEHWPELAWHTSSSPTVHEANLLYLDSAKARTLLGWQSIWSLPDALEATTFWYRCFLDEDRVTSRQQLDSYVKNAADAGAKWAGP